MTSSASATIAPSIRRQGTRAGNRAPADAERDLELQPIARHDLLAELRIVHAAQPGACDRLAVGAVHDQNGRHLRSVSIIRTAGISGAPGKCPWK